MKDFSIAKKMLYGFGSMGVLLLILCGAAFYAVLMSNLRTQELYNQNVVAISAVGEMREAFQEERAMTRSLILFDAGSDTYKGAITQIEQCDADIEAAFTSYEKTITQPENRELFEAAKGIFLGDYATMKAEFKALTDKGDASGALDCLNAAAHINTDLIDDFDQLAALNDTYAETTLYESQRGIVLLIIIGAFLILLTIFWTLFITRYFTKNIGFKIIKVVDAANEIAAGNIDVTLKADSKDELGQLADAFNAMIGSIREQALLAETISTGDLRQEYTPHSEKDVLGTSLVKILTGLDQIFSVIRRTASQVNAGAGQVANGAQALSQGATEQASSVEELSATITDVSGQVLTNASDASNARELAVKAAEEVAKGNAQMSHMIEAMNDINQSSVEISKIIKVIDDIAFQTNILALNAAVEAARAGAAGKGFAVVAEEVRNLAAKSAEAAKDTTNLIQNSISKVAEGTKIAGVTAESLKQIVASVEEVSALIHNIDVASSNQADSLRQVSQGIEQISSVVQTNAATAEESAAASEELSSLAHTLDDALATIKLKGDAESPAAQHTKADSIYSELY